jgi:putative ABC transport system permease protein
MIISVIERRSEIGLRRSLGATRRQIRGQFLAESLLLCALGGGAGTVVGTLVTAGFATMQGWPILVPIWATTGGVLLTLAAGGLAGLYPAIRASLISPTEALTSS